MFGEHFRATIFSGWRLGFRVDGFWGFSGSRGSGLMGLGASGSGTQELRALYKGSKTSGALPRSLC